MARTVLVVDDVAFVRRTLSQILAEGHYQVVGEAEDGLHAVELYNQLRPDLVTMDVVMPKLSGIEATRRIVKLDKDAKVIIISAMDQENLVMEAINAGARDYVLKPFSKEDVLKTLEHALTGGDHQGDRHLSSKEAPK
ncbi:MAG TPA: response regulator [Bdellovibrionota bacterium]|jgi:two-component system chemotaxis response regulator CheY|nr:response regulator [Bdellovibrionota bacterium]